MQTSDQDATGSTSEDSLLSLALSRRSEGDRAGEEVALDRLLEVAPQSLRGLIAKGDIRAGHSDGETACHFYRRALRLAENRPLSQDELGDVAHAGRALAELEARAHAVRETLLTGRGLPPEQWSPRFRHALELAAGRRKPFLQQPTAFNFPELPQIQYYEPSQFGWASAIEAAAPAMREELLKLLEQGTDQFSAYIQKDTSAVELGANKGLLQNKDWSVLFLCQNGWVVPDLVGRCPRTWETVLQAPLPRVAGWGPTVVFSMLKAGAHIAPHTGMFNTRLICHLPLIVPPGCRFRVGNEVREWEEGKLLIFDDTIEHEAWNDSGEDRVVLIFDVWRPELTEQERFELTALFSD